jgi:hypothetical protein
VAEVVATKINDEENVMLDPLIYFNRHYRELTGADTR